VKIISVDNFDREGPGHDDSLVADNVSSGYIKTMVQALNESHSGNGAQRFFRAVEDDYELQVFEP
jgi:hypothetical protein